MLRADGFVSDSRYIMSSEPEAIEYWKGILTHCNEANRIYDNQDGGRDVFGLGTVVNPRL